MLLSPAFYIFPRELGTESSMGISVLIGRFCWVSNCCVIKSNISIVYLSGAEKLYLYAVLYDAIDYKTQEYFLRQ